MTEVAAPDGIPPRVKALMMMPPYPDRFYAAARFAAIPGTVEVAPGSENTTPYTDLTCLALYSLYHQVVHGPCDQPKPWAWNIVELAKWQSWKELGNMSPMEAMRLFIRALEEEEPDWWMKAQELEAQAAAAAADVETEASKAEAVANGDAVADAENTSSTNGVTDAGEPMPVPPVVSTLATQLVEACDDVNSWNEVPTSGRKPSPRYQHSTIVMGHKMIVVGGNTGRFVSDVQSLDLSTLTWSRLDLTSTEASSLPPCAGHCLAALDESTVLVVGGHQRTGAAISERMVVLAIDLETSTWRTLRTAGEIPMARGGHSATRVGSTLWIFGGEDRRRHLLADVFFLDLVTLVWTKLETKGVFPTPRSDHCATIYNDRYLTIFGGGSHTFCYNDVHVLDLENKEWWQATTQGTSPSPRAGHAGVPVGSCWFVVGGGDNKSGLCDTMVLDLDTLMWSTLTTAQERTPISSEGLAVVPVESPRGTLLVAFGGYYGKYSNKLLVLRPDPELLNASKSLLDSVQAEERVALDSSLSSGGRPGSTAVGAQGKKGEQEESNSTGTSQAPLPLDAKADAASGAPPAAVAAEAQEKDPSVGTAPAANGSAPAAALADEKAAAPTPSEASAGPEPAIIPTGSPVIIQELQAQLEEAQSQIQLLEKKVFNTMADSNMEAASAKADAWEAIGKANKEVAEMRESLSAAVAAKQQMEGELAEVTAKAVAAQAAAAAAQAEATELNKELAESKGKTLELQAELSRIGSDAELAKVRKDYSVCKQALADAEQEMQSVRSLLSAEQSRCFKLEVEVAELRQKLSEMGELQAELELLRRQKVASEEAAEAAAAKASRGGWFG